MPSSVSLCGNDLWMWMIRLLFLKYRSFATLLFEGVLSLILTFLIYSVSCIPRGVNHRLQSRSKPDNRALRINIGWLTLLILNPPPSIAVN